MKTGNAKGAALPSADVARRKKTLKAGQQGHLSVAIPSEILIALDAAANRLSAAQGYTVRRSDVVIKALREWLSKQPKGE